MNKKSQNKEHAKSTVVSWTDKGWEDYLSWQKDDPKVVDRINTLIEECRRDPFKGTGKPEPLKGDLSGFWSRRITKEDRLVYLPEDKTIYVVACRYHYDDK
ncbi:MAG: Txe/YoeB family addiction module toxin [Collimonas sp.]|uniref:Txe/YoeB family addiction module toxin n=1 Tax=Collimonas sp. TaxID=1963772 RepID=UPI0032644266